MRLERPGQKPFPLISPTLQGGLAKLPIRSPSWVWTSEPVPSLCDPEGLRVLPTPPQAQCGCSTAAGLSPLPWSRAAVSPSDGSQGELPPENGRSSRPCCDEDADPLASPLSFPLFSSF